MKGSCKFTMLGRKGEHNGSQYENGRTLTGNIRTGCGRAIHTLPVSDIRAI